MLFFVYLCNVMIPSISCSQTTSTEILNTHNIGPILAEIEENIMWPTPREQTAPVASGLHVSAPSTDFQ